jgi:hypothetical protein
MTQAVRTKKWQRSIAWSIILAESTHVFCCVLPTVVTVMAVLASFGAMTQMPVFILDLHAALHGYEVPVIIFSGAMLVAGWTLHTISRRIECQKPHCEPHETVCSGTKDNTRLVLTIASVLFVINVAVYVTLHRGSAELLEAQYTTGSAHDHGDHAHHP